MSPQDESVARDESGTNTDDGLDVAQWLAVGVIVTALGLTVAGSLGVAAFNDSTLRLLLGGGILLSAGVEGTRVVTEWLTAR